MPKTIVIKCAKANNLKNISLEIEYGKLTVCAGPSGSGKSSFAFDTLVFKRDCQIENYPTSIKAISQRISETGKKLEEIEKLEKLENLLIVMDEPLAGTTHEEAIEYSNKIKLLASKNAVVVVEHRREIFEVADKVLVFGPGAGTNGGKLLSIKSGTDYLKSLSKIIVDKKSNNSTKKISASYSEFKKIKNYQVEFFLNTVTSVTGPSKCGKSTYLDAIYKSLDKSRGASERRKALMEVKNKHYIRRPHMIDASPVTKNSKSNVATYYGVSKFLKGENLDITVKEALDFYKDKPLIIRRLKHLQDIGLDYLKLNQPSYTLSGGKLKSRTLLSFIL